MDIAKTFKPKTIFLWQKIADNPEAQRIIRLFPSAQVRIIEHQRKPHSAEMSAAQALLAGKRTLMIGQTSSFIGRFDGRLGTNLHCCPYYKLVPISNGCPYFCTYCYLAFVYRKYSPFIKININYDTMFKQIRKTISLTRNKISFNMGEMLDSLALDHITNLTNKLVPFFSGFSNAYLMLLTKSSNSLNAKEPIDLYESGTATLSERIRAAKLCQDKGWRIRFRIDPGILYQNWQASYAKLIKNTLIQTTPENITIGMLRLLPGHFRLAMDTYGNCARKLCDHKFVKGAADGKLRYPPKERINFYSFLIDMIRSFDKKVSISLCRETREIWKIFKNRCEPKKCNCVVW